MIFPHQDPEFADLLRIVAEDTGLDEALIEKDYWVTHTLWALHQTGLDVWFKGGTTLSKGFGIIRRFSEDLDLKIEPGSASSVPTVENWTSKHKGRVKQRLAFFEALETVVVVPGAPVVLDHPQMDKYARGATYHVQYPGKFIEGLDPSMRPYVQLEVGEARVTPFVLMSLSSFVHQWLEKHGKADEYLDNRPQNVRCIHPLVTLLEKLDAIARRYPREGEEPAPFIRHYEDAALIIKAKDNLPELEASLADLSAEMVAQRQLAGLPRDDDPAFTLADNERKAEMEKAHRAIGPMFWGERLSLDASCEIIRGWLRQFSSPA